MRKLTILSVLVVVVVLTGTFYTAFAECGPDSNCPSCLQKASAKMQSKTAEAAMLCGCPMTPASMKMHQKMDIVQMAEHAGNFNTLLTAIEAAGLNETLKGEGPFTIFAPTDEAFARLQKNELNSLLNDKKRLRAVLTYHVHPGKAMAADLTKFSSLETVNGQKATVMVEHCGMMIDQATILNTDIQCSNGVIHVIDRVILPKDMTL